MGTNGIIPRIITASALALCSTVVLAISPYKATYSVEWHGVNVGESTHQLERLEGDRYVLKSATEPNIPFLPYNYEEESEFLWEGGDITPLVYRYDNYEGIRHKKGTVTFDWKSMKAINARRPKNWETDLSDGMQDKLTHTLKLRQDLLSERSPYEYRVVKATKVRDYRFNILREERIETELGEHDTLVVEHISRRKRRTVFWLDKDREYLLVKMEQHRKGEHVGGGEILKYEPIQTDGESPSEAVAKAETS